jgi:hypothetical protein
MPFLTGTPGSSLTLTPLAAAMSVLLAANCECKTGKSHHGCPRTMVCCPNLSPLPSAPTKGFPGSTLLFLAVFFSGCEAGPPRTAEGPLGGSLCCNCCCLVRAILGYRHLTQTTWVGPRKRPFLALCTTILLWASNARVSKLFHKLGPCCAVLCWHGLCESEILKTQKARANCLQSLVCQLTDVFHNRSSSLGTLGDFA